MINARIRYDNAFILKTLVKRRRAMQACNPIEE